MPEISAVAARKLAKLRKNFLDMDEAEVATFIGAIRDGRARKRRTIAVKSIKEKKDGKGKGKKDEASVEESAKEY